LRAYLDAAYRSVLRTYVLSPPAGLVGLLEAPRVKLVNLAHVDDASGTTLLHEAARRKDLRLVELAVRSGADVLVRDRKGKSVMDVVRKDDRVKAFL
jgi:ankyrin repeat protein